MQAPININELRYNLMSIESAQPPPQRFADLLLDPQQRLVWRVNERIRLPKLSYDLLTVLVRRAPAIVTTEDLLAAVWRDVVVNEETVKQRVSLLRQALGDNSENPIYIESIRGVGYRLIPEVTTVTAVAEGQSIRSSFKVNYKILIAVLVAACAWLLIWGLDTPLDDGERTSQNELSLTSIAVLPFDNISPDPNDAYFADGISEEVLNVLAGVDGLKVASRTSAFSFRGSALTTPEIAKQLGVSHVLDGSVRKQGNQVRISTQLIAARDDSTLWSASYDREISDIFLVQQEIAQAITLAMRDVLDVRTVTVDTPTQDLEAYQLFLRGRELFYQRGAALDGAIGTLRAAVDRDPSFAEAWTVLAAAAIIEWGYSTATREEAAIAIAEEAANKALAINPDLGLALAVQALLAGDRGELIAAFDLHQRALQLDPDDSTSRMWFGQVNYHYGFLADAEAELQRAYDLDPLVGIINGSLGMTHLAAGRDKRAQTHFEKAEELGWVHHAETVFNHLLLQENTEAAIDYYEPFFLETDDAQRRLSWELLIDGLRNPAAIARLVDQAATLHAPQNFNDTTLFLVLDLPDRFFARLSLAVEQDPHWRFRMRPVWLPGNRKYVEDPRFLAVMSDAGALALWEERGYPDGCRRISSPAGDHLDCTARYRR